MTTLSTSLLAQTSAPSTQQSPPSLLQGPFVPLMLALVVLYFFVFRSKRNQEKNRQDMLGKLKPGQRVQTIGGILGVVTQSNDREVTIKVDENNNVKIKFARNAIHRVLDDEAKDKDKAEAAKDAK